MSKFIESELDLAMLLALKFWNGTSIVDGAYSIIAEHHEWEKANPQPTHDAKRE